MAAILLALAVICALLLVATIYFTRSRRRREGDHPHGPTGPRVSYYRD